MDNCGHHCHRHSCHRGGDAGEVSQLRLAGQAVDVVPRPRLLMQTSSVTCTWRPIAPGCLPNGVPRYDNGSILIQSNSRVVVTALLDRLLSPLDGGHHPGDSYRLAKSDAPPICGRLGPALGSNETANRWGQFFNSASETSSSSRLTAIAEQFYPALSGFRKVSICSRALPRAG